RLITRYAIVFESRLALAGARVKLPVVPRADDVIAVEPSVAERTADVIADAGDDAELTVEVRDRKFVAPYDDRLQRLLRQLINRTDIEPVRHREPPLPVE